MTPTLSQLEAMTGDQLNALAAEAMGWISDPELPDLFWIKSKEEKPWGVTTECLSKSDWSPATNICDAMSLPMPNEYTVKYDTHHVGIHHSSWNPNLSVFAPRTLEGEARARTIFFLLTRSDKP